MYVELPGPVAACLPKQALRELGDRVLGGDRIVEHRRVQRAPPPPPLTAPPSHPRHGLPGPTQSKPRHPHRQWAGWYGSDSPPRIQPQTAAAAIADRLNGGGVPLPSPVVGGPSRRFEVWRGRWSTPDSRAMPRCGEPLAQLEIRQSS